MTDSVPGPAPQVFVVGSSRSGTTMMGRVLGRHPSVFTFEELHFFEQWWQPVVPAPAIDRDEATRLAAVLLATQREGYQHHHGGVGFEADAKALVERVAPPITAADVFSTFLATEAAASGATVACDQTPRNLYYLDEILELFPSAVAVAMVRDPRDVLLSQKHRWKRRRLGAQRTTKRNALRTWAGYHPVTMSLLWRSGAQVSGRLAAHPRVIEVRFEDLLEDPEKQVRLVCDRVGLDFRPDMLAVPRIGSSNVADRPDQKGIDASAAGRWRSELTPTETWLSQRITHQEMSAHGYEPADVKPQPAALVREAAAFAVKSGLALALNARRAGNLVEAARRRLGRS